MAWVVKGYRRVLDIPSVIAGNWRCGNGVVLTVTKNFNGAGPKHFGGADEWPVVELHFSFPSDRQDVADKLAVSLEALVRAFISANGLDTR